MATIVCSSFVESATGVDPHVPRQADRLDAIRTQLRKEPLTWLVTGAAGFIGSHCVAQLAQLGQRVVALDSFVTGHPHNLDDVRRGVGSRAWRGVAL